MKKILAFVMLFFAIGIAAQAQKIYSTKSATIRFYSHTPAEDIEATNKNVESKLSDKTGQVMFGLLIKGFTFENSLMQEHFNKPDYMNSDKFPKAEFKGTIANIAAINFAKDGVYNATAEGNLTIKGVTKKVTAKGNITIAKGKVSLKSIFNIHVKDFGVDGSEVAKELEITVTAKYD